jgi:cell division protein FtsL
VKFFRVLNIVVIAALVVAAAYVYKIKFESTQQIERLAKLRSEVRREREAIAALRAEWSMLENPARLQALAQRHMPQLRPVDATQFGSFDKLPERPPQLVPPGSNDPIGDMIGAIDEFPTGSTSADKRKP